MEISIRKVENKKDMKRFIRFNYELYKGNPYAVPDFYEDCVKLFDKKENPSFDFCDADFFLALDEKDKVVGRVAAIVNNNANKKWNVNVVRFGWIDFINDIEVPRALLNTVADWGRERGLTEMQGPLGFTDMDPEGMLLEGYEEISTMSAIYNYPYYPELMDALGFSKATDWVENKLFVPEVMPEKFLRISEIIQKKYGLRIRKLKNAKEVKQNNIGQKIFDTINEAYAPLFGYSKLTERQINQYIDKFLPLIDMRMITLVENEENDIIAVGISMPSLSEALQKAKGKLWPFGWWYLFKVLILKKYPRFTELLLIAVKPEYQNKGVNSLLFTDLIPIYRELGFEWGETNPELEDNLKVQSQWKYIEHKTHKRRRCYTKQID